MMVDLRTVCLLVFLIVLLVEFSTKAQGHEWYDKECCSDKDCAPVTKLSRAPNNKGWIMSTKYASNVFVPDSMRPDKSRASKDSKVHLCVMNLAEHNNPYTSQVDDKQLPRCVYWPSGV